MAHTELTWEQKKSNVFVIIQTKSAREINFQLEPEIINFLAGNTPKFYVFFIKLKGEKEESYFVNFNNLKPVASSQNKLRITVSKKDKMLNSKYIGLETVGRYCIARGESFYERFLSETGWIRQKKYFDLYDYQDVKKNLKQPAANENQQNKSVPENSHKQTTTKLEKKSKLKECVNCGNIISGTYEICPYCSTVLYQQVEENVDIVI